MNQTGVVRARTLTERQGKIVLDGGSTGQTLASGTLDASGRGPGQKGGEIQVLGHHVGITGKALLDASGDAGGGSVLVGGDYQGKNPAIRNASATWFGPDATIRADALTQGDGGKVIVWSDEATRAHGTITARAAAQRRRRRVGRDLGEVSRHRAVSASTPQRPRSAGPMVAGSDQRADPQRPARDRSGLTESPNFDDERDPAIISNGRSRRALNTAYRSVGTVVGEHQRRAETSGSRDIARRSRRSSCADRFRLREEGARIRRQQDAQCGLEQQLNPIGQIRNPPITASGGIRTNGGYCTCRR